MSSDGEFVFISDKFVGESADVEREKLLMSIINKVDPYRLLGTSLSIYPAQKAKSHFKYNPPKLLKIMQSRRHIDGLVKNDADDALEEIEQADALREVAENFGAELYYTSEYTNLYCDEEVQEAFDNGDMLKVTKEQIELWKSKVKQ